MEAVWLLAGVVLGGAVGYLLGFQRPSTAIPQPVQRALTYEDREIGRMELEERFEKLDRMIERYRKRAGPTAGATETATPAVTVPAVFDRTALRRRAIELGLLKGGVHPVVLGERREPDSAVGDGGSG